MKSSPDVRVVVAMLRLRPAKFVRSLAILPQAPLLSLTDQKKLLELRKAAELAALLRRKKAEKARIPPRFNTLRSLRAVLRAYEEKRPALRESDAAAAIVAIGRFGRDAADRQLADPFAARQHAWQALCQVLISANEFIYLKLLSCSGKALLDVNTIARC